MKICVRISTSRLIEAQSGNANLAAMIQNAVNAGIPLADIEAKEVTQDEFQILLSAEGPPSIDLSNPDNHTKVIKALALCVAQVGGLSNAQFKALFKSKWDALP